MSLTSELENHLVVMPGIIEFCRHVVVLFLVAQKQHPFVEGSQDVSGNPSTAIPTTQIPVVVKETNHKYYTTRVLHGATARQYWVDLDSVGDTPTDKGKHVSESLSSHHNRAQGVHLPFLFPFYGHNIVHILLATGGFLFTGPFVHPHLTQSEYIAPLMANFDTSLGNKSTVRYFAKSWKVIVSWENLHLHHKPEAGTFSFQVTLYKNGNITFAYKQIPIRIDKIGSWNHPVAVGLSDAFIMESHSVSTIFQYHKVEIPWEEIVTSTVVFLSPLPTCNRIHNCKDCTTASIGFNCYWCRAADRCSSGIDRSRQQWQNAGCPTDNSTAEHCESGDVTSSSTMTSSEGKTTTRLCRPGEDPAIGGCIATSAGYSTDYTPVFYETSPAYAGRSPVVQAWTTHRRVGAGAAIGISLVVTVIVALTGIITFAYNRPQSRSGQWLIQYRPANLRSRISFWRNRDRETRI